MPKFVKIMHILCYNQYSGPFLAQSLFIYYAVKKGGSLGDLKIEQNKLSKEVSMKKVLLAVIAAMCFTGMAMAQDKPIPEPAPITPEQQAYNDMWQWLLQYENYDKNAASQFMQGIQDKVKLEFPLPQSLQDALTAAAAKRDAAWADLAKRAGCSSVDEFMIKYKSDINFASQYKGAWADIETTYARETSGLTTNYNAEFNKRFQTACVEAIKRIQESANAMH
jgi:hypothetical protein